jgi:N-acetylglutamate synthase-like GNAT family acetyltransferase
MIDCGSLRLRRASVADLPAINRLMQASRAYDGEYRRILEGYRIAQDQIDRDHAVVAERDEQILGFYSLVTSGTPELDLMFVADAAQGMNLGAMLFDDMRRAAARYGIESVTIVSHPPSVGFYERMGAVRVGTKAPSGKVTWERPVLTLAIPAFDSSSSGAPLTI